MDFVNNCKKSRIYMVAKGFNGHNLNMFMITHGVGILN